MLRGAVAAPLLAVAALDDGVREFAFEVGLCRAIERDRIVARQLGASVHGRRVLDVVQIEPGPAFEERVAITPERLPSAAVEADVGPGRARYWKDAFDCHPERAERALELASERGFFERERRNGRTYVRQTTRYPDWFDRLVAVENKPDLDRPGDLERQLRTDVSLAAVDAVVLATASHVTRAHLNRLPAEVGVWRFDPETGDREVRREPAQLPVDEPGVELVAQEPGQTEIRIVSAAEKARLRRRIAERAYGKGWRSYDLPPCARCSPDDDGLPYCEWKERPVHANSECDSDCGGFEPAEPPEVDADRLRAERTPWDPEPEGRARRQSGLDRFL
ncbi:DUF5787 family protein [Halomicrobium sp. LC1Hm]|uniref:DUF5787 family protein n=1 Tax=Halomicrobium sp. LC1Hm TaxID=2610902 RepID=UPI003743DA4D